MMRTIDDIDLSRIGREVSIFKRKDGSEVQVTRDSSIYNNFINIEPMKLSDIKSYDWVNREPERPVNKDVGIVQVGEFKSNVAQDIDANTKEIKNEDILDSTQCGTLNIDMNQNVTLAGTDDILGGFD